MEIYIKEENLEIFKEAPGDDAEGRFFIIATADDLATEFKKEQLLVLLEKATGKPATDKDKSKSLKKLAFELFKELTKDATPPAADAKGKGKTSKTPGTPRAESKLGKLRAYLAEHPVATQAELSEASGYDERNTHTAMAILKNESRTPAPNTIYSTYNKVTKTYTIHPTKEAMEAAAAEVKVSLEAEKKAAAEAKKAEAEAEKARKAEEKAAAKEAAKADA